MILSRPATVFGPDFSLSETSTLTVRLELPMYRTIELPLTVFLMLVDKAVSMRQLGLKLDECLEDYEVVNLVPQKAMGASA
jgi:hypothetical protein